VGALAGILGYLRSVANWVDPPVPAAIKQSLELTQFQSIRQQVPILLSVAAFNVGIIMVVCAYDEMPFATYGWLSLLLLYCVARLMIWSRLLRKPIEADAIPRIVKLNSRAALIMMSLLGLDAALVVAIDLFRSPLLIPISLALGSMAIAHCLYSLRPAAIGALVFGLIPAALAMIATGSFEAKMIGCSMISICLLMIRFVAAQYDQLIASLHMERQIRELAETDPLTSLANRRAIMAAIEGEQASGKGFGIVLLDLDGFKEVNDRLGHHAGDAMLVAVADRLRDAAQEQDYVGRLGGDEFILLCRNLNGEADLSARSTAILAGLCRPVALDGVPVPVAASLGFAQYPADGATIREVIHSADIALYNVKHNRSGKDLPKSLTRAA
jgi:diguanylate cyclase